VSLRAVQVAERPAGWLDSRPAMAELLRVVTADPEMHERMPDFLYQMGARLKAGQALTVAQEGPAAGAWAEWKRTRRAALGEHWTPLPNET
jgi:hypothetical protein